MSYFRLLDSEDVSTDPLKYLWLGRFHPALNPNWMRIIVPINLTICCLILTLAIKGIIISHKTDIFLMAECCQTCILMVHAMGKFLVLLICKNDMLRLLEQKAKFWNIREFDGEIFNECLRISQFVKKIIRCYYTVSTCTCTFFAVQPFTSGYLPTMCYVPQGWFNFLAVILWYLSLSFYFAVAGTDGLFCSLGTSLIIQFKLLARRLNTTRVSSEVNKLIYYHNFLLRYCRDLNRTFKDIFMVQFLVSIASASMSVFIFTQPGNWVNRVKFATYFFYLIVQSAFYCVPLEFIGSTGSDVGNALYKSQWYEINNKNPSLRKSLILVLARAQKSIVFSAYGLVCINLRTFLTICKTTFSFYTYLNTVRK